MSEPARARRSPLHLTALAASAAVALGIGALTVPAAHAAETTHTIAQVQGTGATTPLNGTTVTVEGIVTADYRAQTASGYRGVFIQAEGSGSGAVDPAFGSQGLFVFLGNANPQLALGDKIRVTGVAGEYFNQTQVSATAADAVELVQAAVGVPTPTVLPNVTQGAARESYEGMLVTPESAVLSSSHQLYNFGTLWLNVGEQAVKSTETTDAGPAANAIAAANRANRILVDDGYSIQVSNNAHPGGQPYFEKDEVVRNGDRFVSPAGGMVLSWGFDDWRLQPQVPLSDTSAPATAVYEPTFETVNARPETAPEVGGDVQVGAFNVYNYFTTFEEPARGARSAEQFAIQKSKIVTAINGLGADIVALQEIENSVKLGKPVDSALADLVAGLNEAAGAGTWDYVRTPAALQDATTTDYITNAIIFKPAVATPVGESFTDIDETVWDIAREPVAQTFDAAGKVVTVVSNHLKSKSGDGAEPADGQGQFNAERVEQATRLAGLVQAVIDDPAKSDDVILLGDFNSYAQEDPIQVLTGAGLVDLVPTRAEGQYTYTFDGELGSLDHALVTGSLAENVTGVGVWGINSAEWSDRGYSYPATEAGTPFRSSDHDPINVGISATEAPVDIDVLSINDFHGRLVEAAPAAGAAVLGGVVDQYRAENPNTLFVSAGDSIGASTFDSFVQQDQPTIDVLNEIGLDVSAFGNHEFDRGRADVDERVIPASDFPYISANIYEKGTTEPAYDPYFISEVDGVSVGFIGAITEDMYGLVSPTGIATLDFGDIPTAVNRVADQLQDGDDANGEADVLVLLVHEGAAGPDIAQSTNDSAFGQIVNGVVGNVDAIVSAHTHQVYDHEVPVPGTDRVMPVIQSGQYGESFGHLSLSVDPTTGDLLEISAEVKPLFRAAEPDPEVAAIVANAVAVANELGKQPLGEITSDFKRGVFSNGTTENRGAESTIGNFIADVQLWATEDLGTELAIMNPGGIRADLTYASSGPGDPDGTVTYREAANVQPFANTLVTLTLTGDQLEQVLEEQWQPAGLARPFLKLGLSDGFRYAYDPTAPAGSRITAMYLNGEPVTADQSIKIVTNSFLAGGGDQFFTLAQGTQRADSGRVDLQAISDYFAAESPASPDLAQRSYGVTLSAPDADGYSAGDQVTVGLSSLAFSNGAPTTGTAVVSLGETELASAPLQFAITDFFDEQGSAQVTITIPEGVSGAQALTVSVPETGSSIDVPIEITETEEPVVLSTRTYASLSHTFATPKTSVKLSARVTTPEGAVPTGDVKVYDGTKVIATGTLDDEGRVKLTLPKFSKGIHLVTVRYQGDDGFERSLSVPDVLVVW